MFTVLAEGDQVEAFSAAAKTMKCLQAANGARTIGVQRARRQMHRR